VDAFTSSLGLTVLYLVLLGIGIVYALIILIGGGFEAPGADVELGGDAGPIDLGAGAGDFKMPAVSPVAIASFVTAFGAFGLIGLGLFNATARGSLAWAGLGGLSVALLAHFAFFYFLIKPQGSSEVRLRDIVGALAEVTTPIPAQSVGEVAFVAQGGRLTYTAKSASGAPIPRGTTVVIEKVVGGVAVVRPQE
jgi:membrane protein implicated in regulation of membrane protease activity